jgi:hypothetical protein
MGTAAPRVHTKQIRDFSAITSLMSKDWGLEQGSSQLQTSADH